MHIKTDRFERYLTPKTFKSDDFLYPLLWDQIDYNTANQIIKIEWTDPQLENYDNL